MQKVRGFLLVVMCLGLCGPVVAGPGSSADIDRLASKVERQVIEWRRHFHEFPELSNREFQTAAKIAEVLQGLGIEVQADVAHTGVVGILKGGQSEPVVALRADIDGLPVVERVDLPFASKARSTYNGLDVGVMHACGHDTHIAILLGVASLLSEIRDQIPGTVKFIFQPAEEGAPDGEQGGAALMVKEGVLKAPDVDAIFGLHISGKQDVGTISYRAGGLLAASDVLRIKVRGKQTHGSTPWTGADPIVAAAQIINGLQTIISRQTDLTKAAAVISIGRIEGGVRNNIIPEEVEMVGTIRTLDTEMQERIHDRIRIVATRMAETMGTTAEVTIAKGYPVTFNDTELTRASLPSLKRVAGEGSVLEIPPITGAEDFSFFQKEVPGFFFFLGGKPLGVTEEDAAPHHTPDLFIDESGLTLGVKALTSLTLDYLEEN
jgi:amidohydrolase